MGKEVITIIILFLRNLFFRAWGHFTMNVVLRNERKPYKTILKNFKQIFA